MSRITCLIIFSGSSALSIRSLRFARTSVETLSSSAILRLASCDFYLLNLPLASAFFAFSAPVRPGGLVSDGTHLPEQLRELHARERFEQRRDLRRHLGYVAGNLAHAGGVAVARGNNRDLVDIRQWRGQGAHHFRQVGEQLVDHRRLVVLLVRL